MERTKSMTCRRFGNCAVNTSAPFSMGSMGMNLNMNVNPYSFQQFANSSFNSAVKLQMPTRSMRQAFPSPLPMYPQLPAYQNLRRN